MNGTIRIPGPEWESSTLEQWRFPIDILLHLVLLSLALSPFVVLVLKRKSPVGWRDFWLLFAAFIIAPFGRGWLVGLLPSYQAPFVTGYMVLCMVVLCISILIVARRLKQQSQGSYAFSVLATLLALGVVIGLTLPAVPSAREASRRMACSINIRALGLVLLNSRNYGIDYSLYPPNNRPNKEGGPHISWRVQVLPQLEYRHVRNRYVDSASWDSLENMPLAQTKIAAYTCPSEPNLVSPTGGRFTSYAMLDNSNRNPSNPKRLLSSRSRDQEVFRILLIESCGANIVWSEPRDVDLDTADWLIHPRDRDASLAPWKSKGVGASWHGSGTHAVFGDGSTRFLPSFLDKKVVEHMLRGEPWDESNIE